MYITRTPVKQMYVKWVFVNYYVNLYNLWIIKKKMFCISTGGLSKIISKDINLINTVNENLTILGLIEIFKLNYNEEYSW